ncbi:MAG TPA: hypothetical protein ENG70_05580 [Candidatus Cloacimonetes bacterium]|nr:hypothetical protein [Candidatus Cloacimonadota bacterium]HEX38304.1 hypothetical protein [Candidatus Cloacimonadota bacterium]
MNKQSALYRIFAWIIVILVVAGCSVPQIKLPFALQNDTSMYSVKGRFGFTWNKVITFGGYTTSKFNRGWTTNESNSSDVLQMKSAKQKFNFIQYTPDGKQAEVVCAGHFEESDVNVVNDFFSIDLSYKNYFYGSVLLDKGMDIWNFVVNNPDNISPKNLDMGEAKNDKGDVIKIQGILQVEGQNIQKIFQGSVYGYEFIHNGTTIGAVSTINAGAVWIKNSISDDLKLVLAGMSTSLLVRDDLEEQSNN